MIQLAMMNHVNTPDSSRFSLNPRALLSWLLFGESDDEPLPEDVAATIAEWRAQATRVVLIVVLITMFPGAMMVGFNLGVTLPPTLALLVPGLYLTAFAAFLLSRRFPNWSAVIFIIGTLLLATMQLGTTQLMGSGKMFLLLSMIVAFFLIGPRAGWATFAAGFAIFALTPVLIDRGIINRNPGEFISDPSWFWRIQVINLFSGCMGVLILLIHYHRKQRRALLAEREERLRANLEVADRRRLEEEMVRISEDERRRLGSELHDGLCQHLAGTLLNCSALLYQRKAVDPQGAADIERIRTAIESSIGMAYDVARGLCPVDVTPDGILPALELLCRETSRKSGLSCSFEAPAEFSIANPEHALHLYRITGEAVKNAVRHARCSRLAVRLDEKDGMLRLLVEDDGIGIPTTEKDRKGLGCRIMKYRAALIGGTLDIDRPPSGGTCVTCRVPVPSAVSAASSTPSAEPAEGEPNERLHG